MNLCKFGCGLEGKYKTASNEWICSNNPSKCPQIKKKLSLKMINYIKNNGHPKGFTAKTPWNKGLTKNTSPIIADSIEKIKDTFKKNKSSWLGRKHTEKTKEKMSKTRTEMYLNGWKATSCGRAKKYKYFSLVAGNISVDGKWELAVAKFLDSISVVWVRNTKRFPYINKKGKKSSYCPDFYIFDWNCYLEVKGYVTDNDKLKWKQFPSIIEIWTGDILIKKGIINRSGEVV